MNKEPIRIVSFSKNKTEQAEEELNELYLLGYRPILQSSAGYGYASTLSSTSEIMTFITLELKSVESVMEPYGDSHSDSVGTTKEPESIAARLRALRRKNGLAQENVAIRKREF